MTTLLLLYALDCWTTLSVATWQQLGPPSAWERSTRMERQDGSTVALVPTGCRMSWPDPQPVLLSWCAHLGAERCTATVTP